MSAIDVAIRRLERRRGWLVQLRSRGIPPRSSWRSPVVAETELLRELFPRQPIGELVRTLTIHRARVRDALNAPIEFAKAVP